MNIKIFCPCMLFPSRPG